VKFGNPMVIGKNFHHYRIVGKLGVGVITVENASPGHAKGRVILNFFISTVSARSTKSHEAPRKTWLFRAVSCDFVDRAFGSA
jgi:hypothetical protein